MSAPLTIADCTAEIRAAIGIVALLHSGGVLSADDMRAAVTCIEQELTAIDRLSGTAPAANVPLPLLTLAEVAARDRHRRNGSETRHVAAKPNPLRIIEGGLSS